MRKLVCLVFIALVATSLSADPVPLDDYREVIGYGPGQAVERFGAPDELAVHQEDVVWYYHPGFYLFFFESRVWQIRADERYTSPGVHLQWGESLEELTSRLGAPLARTNDEVFYDLPDSDPRLRLRIYGPEGVSDLYLYRADY